MAMKKRFYTVDGQMVGYEEGGVRKDFLTDHLGSIIAIMDENEVRVFDTRYSAYGRNRWITGTGCGFGWVGSFGYRETGLFHMSHYVRARHYSYTTGSWSTVDPLWPDEASYGYVSGRASSTFDPAGLQGRSIFDQYDWDPRARNCHTGKPVDRVIKRECYDGLFSRCMCDAADAGGRAVGRTGSDNRSNAIAHCTLACTIRAACGKSGAEEWDSREDCHTNWKCCLMPLECQRDSDNNNVGFGIGRFIGGKGLSLPQIAKQCFEKCKSLGAPPLSY